ncbi:MAG: glycosyltransferase family 2 protein [Halobacteriota archaeon]
MNTRPRVVIVILNWNGKEDTAKCLDSLTAITYPNYTILVVDNGSTDGSVEFLSERYSHIQIARNNSNIGFGAGNNIGIELALSMGADYVLLLNNDTTVDAHFLDYLVQEAERDRRIGFAGPKIYRLYEGEAAEYAVWKTFGWKRMPLDAVERTTLLHSAGGSFNAWLGKIRHRGAAEFDVGQYDEQKVVDFVEGSCVLVRRDVINRIGLLDASYFTYLEDVDWCLRGQRAGYATVFVPRAKIWHKGSKSSSHENRVYYYARNKLWLMQKRTTKLQYVAFLFSFLSIQAPLSVILIAGYQKRNRAVELFAKGIIDGLRGPPPNG